VSTQKIGDELVAARADLPRTLKHSISARAAQLGQRCTDDEIDHFVADVIQEWDEAPVGAVIRRTLGDVHLKLPKHEIDTNATVHYFDQPELLDRLCCKVALEAIAIAFGVEFSLRPEFDLLRRYVLYGGAPPVVIKTVRLPSLETPDALLRHTVSIGNFSGSARVRIDFFGSYCKDVLLGPEEPAFGTEPKVLHFDVSVQN
jgi:hypothetical protein